MWRWCIRAAGDTGIYPYLDNQALADLIAGKFPGFGATPIANFTVGGQDPAALVSVAAVNADGDARADLAVGSGAGQESFVRVYLGRGLSGTAEPTSTSFDPFGTTTLNGVFVG